jgi:hypothetical protein
MSELRRAWREPPTDAPVVPLSEGDMEILIKAKSRVLKKRILDRLRNELTIYFVILAIPFLSGIFAHWNSPLHSLLLGVLSCTTIVPIISVLAYKEYRLRTVTLTGTLRDSLATLIEVVDSATKFYLLGYVISVLLSVVVIEILLLRHRDFSIVSVIFVLAGISFVAWSYSSGRRYARRVFENYRRELVGSLNDLEGS